MALSLRENIYKGRRLPRDVDLLIARSELLSQSDRELMEAVLVRGQTVVSVARMMGISARRVGNRVKRLARRLTSGEFLDAARALPYLPPKDAAVASMRFCEGLSKRKLAARLGVSQHILRRRLDRIGAQVAMIRRIQTGNKRRGARSAAGLDAAAGYDWPSAGRSTK